MMDIGLFQLENLASTPARFSMIDLRMEASAISPSVDRLLKQARRATEAQVLVDLQNGQLPKQLPVVLICEDGRKSGELARRLEDAGHEQVYVVAGGVVGLVSES